ncbi:hypothetical protein AAMO2058_000337000 [Amorphochlora amoebiformis]
MMALATGLDRFGWICLIFAFSLLFFVRATSPEGLRGTTGPKVRAWFAGGTRIANPRGLVRVGFSSHWSPPRLFMGEVDIPELEGSKIAICPCPGKRERELPRDLDQLKKWGADAIVTLVERDELRMLRVGDIESETVKRGMKWYHCPIPDFTDPGGPFEAAWAEGAGREVRDILENGGKVVVHCRGGIGRAGTIASRLLVELGVCSPLEALRRIREVRPGAVETWEQEQHVLNTVPLVKR